MIVEFINWCLHHGIPYEQGKNWCDCVNFTTYINFWINGKVHTFYAMDNGSFKLDKVIVNNIEDIEGVLDYELEEHRKAGK